MRAIVGLTGGIASGKSTVAGIFRRLGVHVVDADQVARAVVAKGTPGLARIVAAFGEDVLTTSGELDRAKLASLVFGDAERRRVLESITHPLIAERSMAELQGNVDSPYAIYEAALLVENGSHRAMSALVVVAASEDVQRRRAIERDASSASDVEARIRAQLPLADKIAVADYVIRNDGSIADLEQQTSNVHRALIARFGDAQ